MVRSPRNYNQPWKPKLGTSERQKQTKGSSPKVGNPSADTTCLETLPSSTRVAQPLHQLDRREKTRRNWNGISPALPKVSSYTTNHSSPSLLLTGEHQSIYLNRDLIQNTIKATTPRSIFSLSESVIRTSEISSDHQNYRLHLSGNPETTNTTPSKPQTTKRLHNQRPHMPTTQS